MSKITTREEVFEEVRNILKDEVCVVIDITEESTADDLVLDSLDRMEFALAVEAVFDIELSNEDMESINTLSIKEIVDLILERKDTNQVVELTALDSSSIGTE